MTHWNQLTATSFDRQYYEEHKATGLDYLGHGDWQLHYGRWLTDVLPWRDRRVLDVGCACGSIAQGLRMAGILACGIDCNNHAIGLGREAFPDLPLWVCDTVNLHLFADASLDGIHSNQAAEHFRPDLVPFILREWRRVLRPGGLIFTVLDTTELYERQNRQLAGEDPTHTCVRPLAWWHTALADAGLELVTDVWLAPLAAHAESYLRHYDWDLWMARKSD